MHVNVFACVFHLCSQCKLLYSAKYYSTPTQTVQTVWRRQIINTQGGVVHFRLYSTLWSEGGLGWGGVLSDRDGWLRPWHQFPVSIFPVHPAAPSPLLPGYQTTIAALSTKQPGWVFTGNHVTGTVKTMSVRPCRRAAAQPLGQARRAHCSPWVRVFPVWPSATTKHCWPMLILKEQGSTVYDVPIWINHCAGLLCNCTGMERNSLLVHSYFLLQNWCQIQFHYCTINAASAGCCSFPFIWRDVWQRARFFSEPEKM